MGYIPKSLNAAQQEQILRLIDAFINQNRAEIEIPLLAEWMDIRRIVAEPPTERAPKAAPMARKRGPRGAKVLPVAGSVE